MTLGLIGEFADLLDWRGDYRSGVSGVVKLQVHAAADEAGFQHGASPGRPGDGDLHGLRTILGMAGDHHRFIAEKTRGVVMVLGANVQDGGGRKMFEKDASFNLGLGDLAVHFVAEIGMRREHDLLSQMLLPATTCQ